MRLHPILREQNKLKKKKRNLHPRRNQKRRKE
jgi:hypothetical protein